MTAADVFERAARRGVAMVARDGMAWLEPQRGPISKSLRRDLEKFRQPLIFAVLAAAEAIEHARRQEPLVQRRRQMRGAKP